MGEKTVLISSMQKLINHIRKSEANQEEIFYSLSRTDFKKILSNLQDQNLLLRKTSLNLIAQLLSSNSKLKTKFCQTMEINLIPGKILFNTKTLQRQTNLISLKNILTLLKKEGYQNQNDCLLWYINTKAIGRQFQVQFIERDITKQQMQIDIDPQDCIVGFCMTHSDLFTQYSTSNLSLPITDASDTSKKIQLKNLIEPNPKKIISIAGSKINTTMSDNQPRYQRNNKSYQLETQRPKKFINTFLQQRKLNARGGAQTQRHNTVTYQLSPIMPTQQSVDFKTQQYENSRIQYERVKRPLQVQKQQKQSLKQSTEFSKEINRFTMMPKTAQSPYIPTLNLQNSGHNNSYVYRTERPNDGYMSNKTQGKEMDFHKVKYQQQGIKVTTNPTTRSSLGNPIIRNNNTERNHPTMYSNQITDRPTYLIPGMGVTAQMSGRKQLQNSFQFKYIKPITTSNNQAIKNVNYFHKTNKDQPFNDKKTIDIFQFIKNK